MTIPPMPPYPRILRCLCLACAHTHTLPATPATTLDHRILAALYSTTNTRHPLMFTHQFVT